MCVLGGKFCHAVQSKIDGDDDDDGDGGGK